MRKRDKYILAAVIIVISFGILLATYFLGGKEDIKKDREGSIFVEEEAIPVIVEEKNEFVVEIKGEVKKPDVYRVVEGTILKELIEMAGGVTSEGDISKVNRARKVINNECVVVAKKGEVQEFNLGTGGVSNGLININTASAAELDSLPDIGPSRVEAIIKYREKNGGFKNIEEIKNISGIGEKSFEKMKDLICV